MASTNWIELARELGPTFAERSPTHDTEDDHFVAANYADMKRARLFSASVPEELGGGGASLTEVCEVIRELAKHCGSTALAYSMHSHLVAANVFKHVHGQSAPLLKKIADNELVLVSTGATDWVSSNGSATRVEGGYRIRGRKVFASGSPGADLLITSIASDDEPEGPSVLHFPLSLKAEGVKIQDDWHPLGMRGTGSHSVVIHDAFVPEAAIGLKRPRDAWHPVWNVVLGVALPIIMAAYVGLAEKATAVAMESAKKRSARSGTRRLVGELHNALTSAQVSFEDMVRRGADYQFKPSLEHANAMLIRKTLVTQAAERCVNLAAELCGGASFYRGHPLERAVRDVRAAHFHPLPERRQLEFTGLTCLGEDPAQA